MAHITVSVEYARHGLLWLVDYQGPALSSRDVAELHGVSPSFLDVVDAIEGDKPLFDCQEVRGRCALFADRPPDGATPGACAIHAAMIQAEPAMLASQSLGEIASRFNRTAPDSFRADAAQWIDARLESRAQRRERPPTPAA